LIQKLLGVVWYFDGDELVFVLDCLRIVLEILSPIQVSYKRSAKRSWMH
jgi:hypothetical protein